MKGYKAFGKGLVCEGKQYSENTIFEEDSAVICQKGMHFCENPFDCLDYYPLVNYNGEITEFAEVEALDKVETDDNKKFCTKKLKIGAKLNLGGFIKASIDFLYKKTIIENPKNKISSGDYAQIVSEGKNAVIMCAGQGNIAKGKIGSWITLTEWEMINNEYVPKKVVTKKIDGEKIKEDTFYTLKNGKFKIVKEM